MTKFNHIPPEVADVLKRATIEHNTLTLPAGQLEKPLYAKVDKVLKALGGKWDRRVGGHVFASGAPSDLAEVLAAGKVVDRKKSLEFFETPAALAKEMADAAAAVTDRLPRNIRVLEPSAGHGRLLAAFAEHLDTNGKDTVLAIDIDPDNCAALRAQGIATAVECDDFLAAAATPRRPFDVILMNSPFSRNQDIRHVTTALKLLAEGGVLVALTSMHWTFASEPEAHDFRVMLGMPKGRWMGGFAVPPATHGVKMVTMKQIPAGAFRESGTMVATVMLVIEK